MSSNSTENGKLPGFDFRGDLVQAALYRLVVFLRKNALRGEHVGVRLGASDILAPQALVDVDRGVDGLASLRRDRQQSGRPHFLAHVARAVRGFWFVRHQFTRRDARTKTKLGVARRACHGWLGALALLYVVFAASSKPAQSAGYTRFAQGEMAALTVMADAPPMPVEALRDASGAETNLAAFKGDVLVVNLWATWCAPCVAEMPTLGALQRRFEGALARHPDQRRP